VPGNFTFSLDGASTAGGDSIILYCLTEPSDSIGSSSAIVPISAITNTGAWATGNATNGTNSFLPDTLPADAVTTLEFFPNYEYDGDSVGTAAQVRAELSDASQWDGHEDYIDNLHTQSSFKIVDPPDSSAGGTVGTGLAGTRYLVTAGFLLFGVLAPFL
jgi:hypothetical protein